MMEAIEKYTLYVGLYDKDTRTKLVEDDTARDIINNIVGDCTISDAYGYYTHDNGERVKENTLRIELLFKEEAEVRLYCKEIKERLNQESIAVCKELVPSALF